MKSPTLRNTAQKLGQIIHQSAYAENMQAEAVRAALAAGHAVIHDEIIVTKGSFDFMGPDGVGRNFCRGKKCR